MSGAIQTAWFSWRGSELLGATTGVVTRASDYLVAYYRGGGTQLAKGSSVKGIRGGGGYGMPGVTVGGGGVPALWDVLSTAIDRARSGGGATLVEAVTYRFHGHT